MEKGYANVFHFNGGIPEWRSFKYPLKIDKKLLGVKVRKISADTLHKKLARENLLILDVRSYVLQGFPYTLPGAKNCPLIFLHKEYGKIPKDRQVVIIDPFMKQSPTAAKFLIMKGYNVLGALKGGLNAWKKMGLSLEENGVMERLEDLE